MQGIGIQQHSYPSHSKHFVFPVVLVPLTISEMVDEAAEPGPLRLTRPVEVEVHIFKLFSLVEIEVEVEDEVGIVWY